MRLLLCSCPSEIASDIAQNIIERHLASCINVIPRVKTVVSSKNSPSIQEETLLLIQTPLENLDPLIELIIERHSSKTPAIIALPITSGNFDYLKWAEEDFNKEDPT